ncbi:hypothetical protein FGSG_12761 [Fusarium graminearum PH-1]|nr:hypothetical protein FGSG_12761 [Fusarium graminearum PH-1]ESU11565.1 hypothetical protein FGSG_12761 [Fusarium graminearum PH-1]|eukprot:XP_011324141.1 hypothetical protein FGSG_12761 [Fusarium graminearum PH-1]
MDSVEVEKTVAEGMRNVNSFCNARFADIGILEKLTKRHRRQ